MRLGDDGGTATVQGLYFEDLSEGQSAEMTRVASAGVVEAFAGACHGVDYAHQRGVIHLDLKPHNILVSGFNEVFVIDWGLARVDETDDTGGASAPPPPQAGRRASAGTSKPRSRVERINTIRRYYKSGSEGALRCDVETLAIGFRIGYLCVRIRRD